MPKGIFPSFLVNNQDLVKYLRSLMDIDTPSAFYRMHNIMLPVVAIDEEEDTEVAVETTGNVTGVGSVWCSNLCGPACENSYRFVKSFCVEKNSGTFTISKLQARWISKNLVAPVFLASNHWAISGTDRDWETT